MGMNNNYPATGWIHDLYASVIRGYHNSFVQMSDDELKVIAQGEKPKGFFDALFGGNEDKEIRQKVAISILESRVGG